MLELKGELLKNLRDFRENDLKKIHQVDLKILAEILKLCYQYNIRCFLIGGSALGAIRHKGFIPWDDDIDLGFTRNDYQVFLEHAPLDLKNSCFYFENEKFDPGFEFPYSKIIQKGTFIVERLRETAKAYNGIFVDLFPFDRLPKRRADQIWQKNLLKKLTREINRRIYPEKLSNDLSVPEFFKIPITELYKKRENVMKKFNYEKDGTFVDLSSPYNYGQETISPDEMKKMIKVPFENYEAFIVKDYDDYLTRLYGSYMKLPPFNKQKPKHILKLSINNNVV